MSTEEYDYIICGAGLAGLSLAVRLADAKFSDRKILIVDRDKKDKNDRTWSFWQLESERRYESIFYKTWDQLVFHAPDFTKTFETAPYQYRTIRGIDFYNYAKEVIDNCEHITFLLGDVGGIEETDGRTVVTVSGVKYQSSYVFDSIVRKFPEQDKLFVWQHFMGWQLESESGGFDPNMATFMDFRIDQREDVRFVYVLPWDNNRALIEATLFSKEICESQVYEDILQAYMKEYLPDINYRIVEKETGAIPMTSSSFSMGSNRVIPIGTNNGTVKASSGYAFVRIQEECDLLIGQIENGVFRKIKRRKKFKAYDQTLLNVILTGKVTGQQAFADMFRYNDPVQILKFLNEKTSLLEEAKFFRTLPIVAFTRAFIEEMSPF